MAMNKKREDDMDFSKITEDALHGKENPKLEQRHRETDDAVDYLKNIGFKLAISNVEDGNAEIHISAPLNLFKSTFLEPEAVIEMQELAEDLYAILVGDLSQPQRTPTQKFRVAIEHLQRISILNSIFVLLPKQ